MECKAKAKTTINMLQSIDLTRMECKGRSLAILHSSIDSIDLTRMECKVYRHTSMPGLDYGIDLTRMECKVFLEKASFPGITYRFNQNGM